MPGKTDAFRANVRRYVRLTRTTYTELAEKADLSREWLSKMLAGKSNPTLPVCERIATALGVSLEALVAETTTSSVGAQEPPLHFVSGSLLDKM